MPVSKFIPPKNTNEISVSRMDLAPAATLAELGTRNASQSGKMFWGCYTLTAGYIQEVGCSVKASPLTTSSRVPSSAPPARTTASPSILSRGTSIRTGPDERGGGACPGGQEQYTSHPG